MGCTQGLHYPILMGDRRGTDAFTKIVISIVILI